MITITLLCRSAITGKHHTLEFFEAPPFFGDEVYCRLCRAMSRVLVAPHEGRARCLDCHWTTRQQLGAGRARSAASKHLARRQDHRVRVFQGARYLGMLDSLTCEDADFSDEFAETA